jgi:hypothetical protein
MGFPASEVCYTSTTTGRGGHEVHKGHVVALGEKLDDKSKIVPASDLRMWNVGIAPLIGNHGTRWERVVRFTPEFLLPRGKADGTH